MKTEKAYYVRTHRYTFRSGEPAEILGIEMVQPKEGDTFRSCFKVRYAAGKEDYTPISEVGNYNILRGSSVRPSLTVRGDSP